MLPELALWRFCLEESHFAEDDANVAEINTGSRGKTPFQIDGGLG